MLPRSFRSMIPAGRRSRRVLSGLARGTLLPVDLRADASQWAGIYEHEIARWFQRAVAPGTTVYDIGSGNGYYALAAWRLSQGAPTYAFDAAEERCAEIRSTARANGADIRVAQLAFGARSGEALTEATFGDMRSIHGTPARKFVALDDFVLGEPRPAPPAVVKLDVEGGEARLLAGASRVLREIRPVWIVEVHSDALRDECQRTFESLGYRTELRTPRRWLPESRFPGNAWLSAWPTPEAT